MSNTTAERTTYATCGAQGTGWHDTDRCGSRAALVMFWRDQQDKGRAASLCEDCASEMIGNEAQFCRIPVAS